MTVTIFDLQVAGYFLPRFESTQLLVQKGKDKTDWQPSWISDWNNFSQFLSAVPWYFLLSLEFGLSIQEMKGKTDL